MVEQSQELCNNFRKTIATYCIYRMSDEQRPQNSSISNSIAPAGTALASASGSTRRGSVFVVLSSAKITVDDSANDEGIAGLFAPIVNLTDGFGGLTAGGARGRVVDPEGARGKVVDPGPAAPGFAPGNPPLNSAHRGQSFLDVFM